MSEKRFTFTCRHCGDEFGANHDNRQFCSEEHRRASFVSEGGGTPRDPCPACSERHLYQSAEDTCINRHQRARESAIKAGDESLRQSRELDAVVQDAFYGFVSSHGKKPGKAPKRRAA